MFGSDPGRTGGPSGATSGPEEEERRTFPGVSIVSIVSIQLCSLKIPPPADQEPLSKYFCVFPVEGRTQIRAKLTVSLLVSSHGFKIVKVARGQTFVFYEIT